MASPPAKVEVAVVEVAVKISETVSPTTESVAYGVDVPMPTKPEEVTLKKVFVVDEETCSKSAVCPAVPTTSRETMFKASESF